MKTIKRFTLGLIFCLFAINSFATSVTIVTSGFTFVPDIVTITDGDTVYFQGLSITHPLVFTSDSSTLYMADTFFVLTVGTHDYFCQNHGVSFGMDGSITVLALSVPITVDSTDFATVGDTILIANDTVPPVGISIGGTGQQAWDFTSLQVDYLDTLKFRDINNATDDSLFPGSNLVMETPYQNSYLDFNSSLLNILGFYGNPLPIGNDTSLYFDPPQKRMEFPSTFGNSFNDTTGFIITIPGGAIDPQLPSFGLDTLRINRSGYITSQIDAYGTVQLPSGTFNTIRQLYVEDTRDSIFAYCRDSSAICFTLLGLPVGWGLVPPALLPQAGLPPENPITDTAYTYRWLANGRDFPVVELETDGPAGNVTVARFKIDTTVAAQITSVTGALCKDSCNGVAVANGISGVEPYSYLWNDPNSQTTATATGLCDGTYSVMVIDAINDTSIAAIAIINEPVAALSGGPITTTPDTSGNADGTATVTGVTGGTGTYTYSWNSTPPQTSSIATNLAAGPYTVTVTDANGCTFAISATVGSYTNINEVIDAKNGIRIYPNPAVNELNVVAPLLNEGVVKIYNIIGKQLINVALEGTITEVNTSELARGLYIYQVADVEGNVLKNGKFSVLR